MGKLAFKPPLVLTRASDKDSEFIWPADYPVDMLGLDENSRRDIEVDQSLSKIRGLMVQFSEHQTVELHGDRSMKTANKDGLVHFGTLKLPDGSTKAQTNLLRVRLPDGNVATIGVIHKRNDRNAVVILSQPRGLAQP